MFYKLFKCILKCNKLTGYEYTIQFQSWFSFVIHPYNYLEPVECQDKSQFMVKVGKQSKQFYLQKPY